jgi:hypothetical protein
MPIWKYHFYVLLFCTYLHVVSLFWNTLLGTWFELTMFCVTYRSSSLEPEGTPSSKSKPREHIIPIHVEQDADESSTVSSPPTAKPSIQRQRSVSHRYCPQTYAYIKQHSVTLLWGSSFMKVVSCINIWYPIQIHHMIWMFVTMNSLHIEGERHLFLIGRKIHSVYTFLANFLPLRKKKIVVRCCWCFLCYQPCIKLIFTKFV